MGLWIDNGGDIPRLDENKLIKVQDFALAIICLI
jgi:hypothetical protein